MNEYGYKELSEKALSATASQADIDALGEWFQQYGNAYWNGEFYEIDQQNRLFPVYSPEPDEYDSFPLLRYEIR